MIKKIPTRLKKFAKITFNNKKSNTIPWSDLINRSLNEIYIFNKDTLRFEYVNKGAEKNLGYSMEQLQRMTPLDVKPEFNHESFHKLLLPLLRNEKEILVFDTMHRRADGSIYPVEVHLQLFKQREREFFLAFILDITERKQLEKIEIESAKRLGLYIQKAPIGIIEWDKDFQVSDWNPAVEKIFGYSKKEVMGKHARFIIPKDVWPHVDQIWQQLLAGKINQSINENITKDGRTIICEWHNAPLASSDKNVFGVVSMVMDITERKKAEEDLFNSEERFRFSSKAINNIIWDWNLSDHSVLWSEGINTLFGYKINNLNTSDKWWIEHIHQEDRLRVSESIMSIIKGNGSHWKNEYRFITNYGTYAYVEDHGYVVRDKNGKAYRMIGAMQDLTEKKEEEDKIRKNEERFYKLLTNSQDIIIISDPRGEIKYVSPSVKRVLGFTPEEYKSIVLKQVYPEDLPVVNDAVKKVMDRSIKDPVTSVFRVKNKKGEWRWIESVAKYEKDELIAGIVSNCHDITELKNKEENIKVHADELAKINQLMVGRELRMIEMKKKITELESMLSSKDK